MSRMTVKDFKAYIAALPEAWDDKELSYVDFSGYDDIHSHVSLREGVSIESCYCEKDDEAKPVAERFVTETVLQELDSFHKPDACAGHFCVIHNPSDHHMKDWPKLVRASGLIERECKHGQGHPDPDSVDYFERHGIEGMGVHGCDGCCRKVVETVIEQHGSPPLRNFVDSVSVTMKEWNRKG